MHICLLGDSIFDNGAYTAGGPDVVSQLRDMMGPDHSATLLAVDGSMMSDIAGQIHGLHDDCTHIALSTGGNDALVRADILDKSVQSVGEALREMADITADFETSYRAALNQTLGLGRPTVVCTIYNGAFDEETDIVIRAALRMYNDVIFQAAMDYGLAIVDLRRVCATKADYANPIEPSSIGGAKIAAAILEAVAVDSPTRTVLLPSGSPART